MEDRPLATTSCRARDVLFRRELRRIGRSTTRRHGTVKEIEKFSRDNKTT
jgi:hypothetical protein